MYVGKCVNECAVCVCVWECISTWECSVCLWACSVASIVWLIVTPRTIALQASLSMWFSRQEYLSGLPCSPLRVLPDAGIKPESPTLQVDFYLQGFLPLHLSLWGSPICEHMCVQMCMFVTICMSLCVYTCVFMVQIENNSAGDSSTKVLVILPCSCFSTYKTEITIHLVDMEMHHTIKHLEIALLDIK